MDRELMIRLAEEAGLEPRLWNHTDAFERFAVLVAEHKREECAKVCEERKTSPAVWLIDKSYNQAVEDCAAAIRSRT